MKLCTEANKERNKRKKTLLGKENTWKRPISAVQQINKLDIRKINYNPVLFSREFTQVCGYKKPAQGTQKYFSEVFGFVSYMHMQKIYPKEKKTQ